MKLFEIFSTKKAFRFVESVDKLLNNVDTALIIFKDGVRCYLYNDMEGFADDLMGRIVGDKQQRAFEIFQYVLFIPSCG